VWTKLRGDGEALIHEDVCLEAVRLARLLVRHPSTATPETHACVALLLLQAARLPARVTDSGDLAVLSEQDQSRDRARDAGPSPCRPGGPARRR